MKGKVLMGALVVALLAGMASATMISQVTFSIVIPELTAPWTFWAGINDAATDDYDGGIDAVEPPVSPMSEIRMHSDVGFAQGMLAGDYRPGDEVGLPGYFPGGGVAWEFWPNVYVDGYNLTPGTHNAEITWDLSQAGGWLYYLYNVDTGELIDLQTAIQPLIVPVDGRSGLGPWFELGAQIIPEPGTVALLLSGIAGVTAFGIRRR